MNAPNKSEYNPYYGTYINKIEGDVYEALTKVAREITDYLENTSPNKLHSAYEEGKWTVAELIQHLIDTERVMAYRALRIARGDKTHLPGFDQDVFVKNMDVSHKNTQDLIQEYKTQRAATLSFFKSLTEEETKRLGTASENSVSVRALAYIIAGHDKHHLEVLLERY